jgi:hypothetical protein
VIAKHQLESLEAMVQLFLIALESVSKEKENIENQLEEFYKNSASYVQTNLGISNYASLPGMGEVSSALPT